MDHASSTKGKEKDVAVVHSSRKAKYILAAQDQKEQAQQRVSYLTN